jgi:metallophosphoesterase (TIGR03767 family)
MDTPTFLRRSSEVHRVRTEFGNSDLHTTRSATVLKLLHLTDLHVMDAGSPARCDWVEAKADDPKWHPLLHMARPHDTLANWGLAALIRGISNNGGDFADLVITTGDNIDNAQRNELDAYLALMDGGSFAFPYEGPQRSSWAADPRCEALRTRAEGFWPFWLPDGPRDGTGPDIWTALRGLPTVPGVLNETESNLVSPGVGLPWLSVLGNHDVLRQGTVRTTPDLEAIAVGSWRAATGMALDPPVPFDHYMANPAAFSSGPDRFPVRSDAGRRSIDRSEFIRAHRMRANHIGFTSDTSGDYVCDTEHVRIVALDTNHPAGHYQGSIGAAQLEWLDDVLLMADIELRPVLVVSHHGGVSLDNTYTDGSHTNDDRRLAVDLETVLHRHRCVLAWLVGHRHVHRIRPVLDPLGVGRGFWEITTGSTIDYPCQARVVEVMVDQNGEFLLRTTLVDHSDTDMYADEIPQALAAHHRHIAALVAGVGSAGSVREPQPKSAAARRVGLPGDRNTILPLPA